MRRPLKNPLEDLNKNYNVNFLQKIKKIALIMHSWLASNPKGRIGGIERKSKVSESKEIYTIVTIGKEKEITATPYFLLKN